MHETIINDAGRVAAGFAHERNDCTVRALTTVTGIEYAEAHAIMKLAGRVDRHGLEMHTAILKKKIEGYRFERVGYAPRTIQRFIRENPQGRFLCRMTHHVFAIADGRVFDNHTNGPRSIVTHAWKVFPVKMING